MGVAVIIRFVALTGRLCCVAVTGPCCAFGYVACLECVMLVGVSLENNRRFGKRAPASAAADGGFGVYSNGSMSAGSPSASASVSAAVLELDAAAELN